MLRSNGIDPSKFNSDKIYKIIKKFKIPYDTLTKESVLQIIINQDRNYRAGSRSSVNETIMKSRAKRKQGLKERNNKIITRVKKQPESYDKLSTDNLYSQPKTENSRRRRNTRRLNNLSDDCVNYITRNISEDSVQNNINIIIDKSILFKNFVREEEERSKISASSNPERVPMIQSGYSKSFNKPGKMSLL